MRSSSDLFYENGTTYDQSTILDASFNLNRTALEEQGLPWYATTNAIYYLGQGCRTLQRNGLEWRHDANLFE